MAAMKTNAKRVLLYLKENVDQNVSAADVAEALGLEKRQVDGIFTSAFQRKYLGWREEAEITLEDGSHKKVKWLHLNEDGMSLDPERQD